MTEIPETLQASMAKFAELIEAMEADPSVVLASDNYDIAFKAMEKIQEDVNQARAPFLMQIDVLTNNILDRTLELGYSVEHAGVKVSHRAGYEKVTWNSKEMDSLCMKNPALLDLLGSARKVTEIDASVSLKYTPPELEEAEAVEAPF